jgi:hypothetical protein
MSSLFGFAYKTSTSDTYNYLSTIVPLSDTNVKRVSQLDWNNVDIVGPSFDSFTSFITSS